MWFFIPLASPNADISFNSFLQTQINKGCATLSSVGDKGYSSNIQNAVALIELKWCIFESDWTVHVEYTGDLKKNIENKSPLFLKKFNIVLNWRCFWTRFTEIRNSMISYEISVQSNDKEHAHSFRRHQITKSASVTFKSAYDTMLISVPRKIFMKLPSFHPKIRYYFCCSQEYKHCLKKFCCPSSTMLWTI